MLMPTGTRSDVLSVLQARIRMTSLMNYCIFCNPLELSELLCFIYSFHAVKRAFYFFQLVDFQPSTLLITLFCPLQIRMVRIGG